MASHSSQPAQPAWPALSNLLRNRAVAPVLIALLCLTLLGLYQRVETPGADPSIYAGLAENLLAGRGYQYNFEPHTMYPPGLPLLFVMAGTGYVARVGVIIACAFLGLLAAHAVLRRRLAAGPALAITFMLGGSGFFIARATAMPMSDVPYFALAFLGLWATDRLWYDPLAAWKRCLLVVLLALVVALCAVMRTVGIVLMPAIFFFVAARWRCGEPAGWARAASFTLPLLAGVLAFLSWMSWASAHRAERLDGEFSDQYVAHLLMKDFHDTEAGRAGAADLAARVVTSCGCAGSSFSQTVLTSNWIAPYFWNPLVTLPCLLILAGLLRSLARGGGDAADYYLIFSACVLLPWWFCDDGQRFILPLFPVLALEIARAASWLAELWSKNPARLGHWLMACGGVSLAGSLLVLWLSAARPGMQFWAAVLFWLALGLGGVLLAWRPPKLRAVGLPRRVRLAGVLLGAGLVSSGLMLQLAVAARKVNPQPERMIHYPSLQAGAWIAEHTAPDAVIWAEQNAILHRVTERRVVALPATNDPRLLLGIIGKRQIGWLVVEQRRGFRRPDGRALLATLQRALPVPPRLVAEGRGYGIYQLSPP